MNTSRRHTFIWVLSALVVLAFAWALYAHWPSMAHKDRPMGMGGRAEPVAALYEQGKVHHVGHHENWAKMERQMRVFTGINGRRDDRTDAMCWGMHELLVEAVGFAFV